MFFRAILFASLATGAAFAVTVAPQCPGSSNTPTNVVALGGPPSGSNVTFCVSDYGWTNGWFTSDSPGNNPGNQGTNLLGDSAQFLSYFLGTTQYQSWLTPDLSTGSVSSDFNVLTQVQGSGDSATSEIGDAHGVDITIASAVVNDMLRQTFTVTNNTGQAMTNLVFGQYFNFYPGGANDTSVGTISYQLVTTIEGDTQLGLFVSASGAPYAGGTCGGPGNAGCSTPNAHDLGTPSSVQGDVFNTPNN